MNTIANPTGAACGITCLAAIFSITSLYLAEDSKEKSFADIKKNSREEGVFRWVTRVLVVVLIGTGYVCLHYLMPNLLPLPAFVNSYDHWVVRGLALGMLALLAVVIWLTGGVMQSWFTPFLLVLIPLLILLNERESLVLWFFFLAVVGVYYLIVFIIPSSSFDVYKTEIAQKRYKKCCFMFVLIAVFFPLCLQLIST